MHLPCAQPPTVDMPAMIVIMKLKITTDNISATAERPDGFTRTLGPGESITIGGAHITFTDNGIEIVETANTGTTVNMHAGNTSGSVFQVGSVNSLNR